MNLFLITFIPTLILGFIAAFVYNVWSFNRSARRLDRYMAVNPNIIRVELGDNTQLVRRDS